MFIRFSHIHLTMQNHIIILSHQNNRKFNKYSWWFFFHIGMWIFVHVSFDFSGSTSTQNHKMYIVASKILCNYPVTLRSISIRSQTILGIRQTIRNSESIIYTFKSSYAIDSQNNRGRPLYLIILWLFGDYSVMILIFRW